MSPPNTGRKRPTSLHDIPAKLNSWVSCRFPVTPHDSECKLPPRGGGAQPLVLL